MKETKKHYVLKMDKAINPSEAEEICQQIFSTSLGSVHSQEENDEIAQALKDLGGIDAWTSMYKSGNSWNWRDGTGNDIMGSDSCYYHNWRETEPTKGDDCGRIEHEGTWAGCFVSVSLSHRIQLIHPYSLFRDMWQ